MPNRPSGRINYLELPAEDAVGSAQFYVNAFGWRTRRTNGAAPMLEDSSGEISISFASDRRPVSDGGVLLYILVDSVASTCRRVEKFGAEIVQEIGMEAPDVTARFRDPGGNVIEIYQEAPVKSRNRSAEGHVLLSPGGAVVLAMGMAVAVGLLVVLLWVYV